MKGCRADSLPKGAASIIFLDKDAAHDHGISGRVAAQLRHAGVRLAVVIAAGAALTTTAAMSAAATTTAARIAADEQRHSTNTSRIASVRARVGERARSSEPADWGESGRLRPIRRYYGFVSRTYPCEFTPLELYSSGSRVHPPVKGVQIAADPGATSLSCRITSRGWPSAIDSATTVKIDPGGLVCCD